MEYQTNDSTHHSKRVLFLGSEQPLLLFRRNSLSSVPPQFHIDLVQNSRSHPSPTVIYHLIIMPAITEETQFERSGMNPAVLEALNSFSHSVSIGISVLVRRLGYSPSRAADSILHTMIGGEYKLEDDKVCDL